MKLLDLIIDCETFQAGNLNGLWNEATQVYKVTCNDVLILVRWQEGILLNTTKYDKKTTRLQNMLRKHFEVDDICYREVSERTINLYQDF